MLIVAERKRLGQLVKKSILGWRKMKRAFAILILLRRSEGMEKQQYVCEKCGNMHYVSDQFQATGGNFAKILMFKIKIYYN